MHKDWSQIITMEDLAKIYQILILVFESLNLTDKEFENLHLPTPKRCFHLHPNAFCGIARGLCKRDEVWKRMPELFRFETHSRQTEAVGRNCLVEYTKTREQVRAELQSIFECYNEK